MLVGHPLSEARTCENDEEEMPLNQAYGCRKAQSSGLPHQPSPTLPQSLMAQAVRDEPQCRSLKELKPCSANFQLSRDRYGRSSSFYLADRASLAPPPVNEELVGLRPVSAIWLPCLMASLLSPPVVLSTVQCLWWWSWQQLSGSHARLPPHYLGYRYPVVSVSSSLLAQKKVCDSMADIPSWMNQVLATWVGAASSMEQDVLEFLSALAKANKDILCPAEELRCRLPMLQRQVVVDLLPHTFSDKEKQQLLSFPFTDILFDPAVVARVQDTEHLASQQRALSFVVWGLASSFWGSASALYGAR
ncbi:hypothetical protein E2C01_038654 [Portunus trituberculatus]|uniref:Uncharacterized protein n=1 Tax=Portunus trituberculatus TaxID=210409 RepID=A0A5B7FEP8_PORTR|nr:hypothetical protein [Portunus trituberculatus]